MALLSQILASSIVRGEKGPTATVQLGTTTSLNPTQSPTITNSGSSGAAVFNFGIPRAATISLNATPAVSVLPNVSPSISNSGTNGDAVYQFSIPRAPTVSLNATPVVTVVPTTNPSVSNSGTNGDAVYQFSLPRAATITLGTVTTGAAGTSASITNTGTNGDAVFNFTIPQGAAGEVTLAGVQTLTNKTLTIPIISVAATPAAPASDVKLYAKSIGGRVFPTMIGAVGNEYSVQPHFARNKIAWVNPEGNTSTVATNGITIVAVGTATIYTNAVTNTYTSTRKIEYLVTAAATNAIAGFYSAQAPYFIGTAAGGGLTSLGGFYFVCRFGMATGTATATRRCFVGMQNSQVAPTDVQPSSLLSIIGIGFDAADTTFQFMTNAGAGTATKTDTGIARPAADRTKMYEIAIFVAAGASTVYYTFQDLQTGTSFAGSKNTNLPAVNALLAPRGFFSAGGTSSVIGFGLTSLYIETDN